MTVLLSATKERDNTWLQLPVCPSLLNGRNKLNSFTPDNQEAVNDDDDRSEQQTCEGLDSCLYAHPSPSVLNNVLGSGHIVCCHDFIFKSRQGGCVRVNCKYFHPPDKLKLLVINAGRNNLRLRHQLDQEQQRQWMQQGQQQQQVWMQQHHQQQVLQQPLGISPLITSAPSFYLPSALNVGGLMSSLIAPSPSLQTPSPMVVSSRKRPNEDQEQGLGNPKRLIDTNEETLITWPNSSLANSMLTPHLNLLPASNLFTTNMVLPMWNTANQIGAVQATENNPIMQSQHVSNIYQQPHFQF